VLVNKKKKTIVIFNGDLPIILHTVHHTAGTCINSKFMARKDVDNCFSKKKNQFKSRYTSFLSNSKLRVQSVENLKPIFNLVFNQRKRRFQTTLPLGTTKSNKFSLLELNIA
jgi:hypothetical protein